MSSNVKEAKKAALPSLDHITLEDEQSVYIPSDDTFLLCDALLLDIDSFSMPSVVSVLEIGCGSGCVITYVALLLRQLNKHSIIFATDINPSALALTDRTARENHVSVNLFQSSMAKGFSAVDLLIFNPPYVPTPSEEVKGNGIEVSWAGGIDGREVINEFLEQIPVLLTSSGACYLVLVEENKPNEIQQILIERFNCLSKIIMRRKARNESLMIMKITKEKISESGSL